MPSWAESSASVSVSSVPIAIVPTLAAGSTGVRPSIAKPSPKEPPGP